MKLNKVLGAYLQDLGTQISEQSDPLCPEFLSDLLMVLNKFEQKKEVKKEEESITDQAAKEILEKRESEMTPEECLACELMNMLGVKDDILSTPGEHISATKPTIKIKVKKISSKDDLNKILKELKNGGTIDLNTMNDSLGEIFDLNSIQEIMETPMFKQGGKVEEEETSNNETTLEEFLND